MRVVVTSVGYGDLLEVTLSAWKAVAPKGSLVVATSPEDVESISVAEARDVPVVVTDAWTRDDPSCHKGRPSTFNMALGMDVAFGFVEEVTRPMKSGEVCAHVNPDCYPFGTWPKDSTIKQDTVYGFWRHECLSHQHLTEHVAGNRPLHHFPRLKNSHGWPIGYCQIFRAAPGRRFGSYPTAGKFDTDFSRTFSRQEMLSDVYLLHLGAINVRENWGGRVVPRWTA